ncbi:hypothetical protein GCM10022281_18940 [Sphingomonas rosea]|uniref:OmpR/PhoB-type domain-containing protein n=1 Tax=Sphingomonas rosea TaxID=335605 RepID=A0ABP7U9F4_9SPHN
MDAVIRALPPIVLAHQPAFGIGALEVRPETCELVAAEGVVVTEPRVMQVLVALHEADGHVVSRDDLLARCWSGRIVGEDAIHRVISRLRHDAEKVGGHFRIETVTRVGYRMVPHGEPSALASARPAQVAPPISRRTLFAGAGALALVAASGVAWRGWRGDSLPPAAAAKLSEGYELWRLGNVESFAAAEVAFREAAAIAPDHAEPWGLLAVAYAQHARTGAPGEYAEVVRQARAATARALSIDPDNADALAAGIALDFARPDHPLADIDRRLTAALGRHPASPSLLRIATFFLDQVGRGQAALASFKRLQAADPGLDSINGAALAYDLFKAGRVVEADAMIDEVRERWPKNVPAYFTQLKILMFTRRFDRALAMLDDQDLRPVGVPDWNFALVRSQILGLSSPADHRERAIAETIAAAPKGTGFAENGALFLAAVGRVDQAFDLAEALLAGKGFAVSSQRFTSEQGHFDNRRRRTAFLFEPATRPLRSHPRFAGLTAATGLDAYWRATGQRPDYRA